MAALREVVETTGLFGALYSDRDFFVTPRWESRLISTG
jgi:hypothetical protein